MSDSQRKRGPSYPTGYEFRAESEGPSYEWHGYRYAVHRIVSQGQAFSRGRCFRHYATVPDGARLELPFPKRFIAISDMFKLWVDLHRGTFALHHDGHRYVPERSNQWTAPKPRYRHRVLLSDGTELIAPFKPQSVLTPQAFTLWLRLGRPEPADFGRLKLSNPLMSELQKVMNQWDVADDQLSSLVMLHAFHTKG